MSHLVSDGIITLKKGEGRFLKAGGGWIFDNEIASVRGNFENGEILRVEDFDGFFLGYGFYNEASRIRLRMLSRRSEEPIDRAFLRKRVEDAWNYRKRVIDTSSCRVIFGEADFLPGLVVDKYEDVLVVESLALGIDRLKPMILEDLVKILAEDGIRIRGIYERSEAPVRKKEGMKPAKGFIGEAFPTEIEIVENGVRYLVDVENGQKTGFFLDQKLNRRAIRPLVKGLTVLDCFTHMGTFALNAGQAGAKSVEGLDISEYAIAQARRNAELNGLSDTVKFRTADVLDELPRLYEAGVRYDMVILDPPAFTKSREATKNAIRGYREINRKGLMLVKDGGFLATCSCSHFMTQELFTKTIAEAARSAHRRLRQIEFRTQAPDHPILWGADDSYYLKFYIFQVSVEK